MRHVTWRLATDGTDGTNDDRPALKEMHAEIEHKVGHKLDCPDVFTEPVLAAVVAEVDGVIIQGLYLEATAEACASSPHVLAAKEMAEGVAMLEAVARQYKIRLVRCFVPQELALPNRNGRPSAIERMLKKLRFTRESPGYQQYFRWLARRS